MVAPTLFKDEEVAGLPCIGKGMSGALPPRLALLDSPRRHAGISDDEADEGSSYFLLSFA
jgi:hypothetical protein